MARINVAPIRKTRLMSVVECSGGICPDKLKLMKMDLEAINEKNCEQVTEKSHQLVAELIPEKIQNIARRFSVINP